MSLACYTGNLSCSSLVASRLHLLVMSPSWAEKKRRSGVIGYSSTLKPEITLTPSVWGATGTDGSRQEAQILMSPLHPQYCIGASAGARENLRLLYRRDGRPSWEAFLDFKLSIWETAGKMSFWITHTSSLELPIYCVHNIHQTTIDSSALASCGFYCYYHAELSVTDIIRYLVLFFASGVRIVEWEFQSLFRSHT